MLHLSDRNEGEYVSIPEMLQWLRDHRRPDGLAQPLLIWGSAGIGKTERVEDYCAQKGFKVNKYLPAHDTSGEDLAGVRQSEGGRTVRQLPMWLPRDDDPPGALFIDEINRAPQSVQDGLLELCGSGTLSLADYRLPRGWQIVAAANPADLEHEVHDIDNAMIDRFIHMAPGYDAAVWAAWADGQKQLHPSVVDFALSDPANVERGEAGFPLAIANRINPTPRSYAMLGFLIADGITEKMLFSLALGMLGGKMAPAYIAHWEAWKQGARALHLNDILNTQAFDAALAEWTHKDTLYLIVATNERLIADLMERAVSEDIASIVGRYLALIPLAQRTQFLDSAQRVIPHWIKSLDDACQEWAGRFSDGR